MTEFLLIVQTVVSILVISLVLIQARGTGFGRGSSSSFTRRGVEKLTFRLTFFFVVVFLIVSIVRFLV